jgi:putative acetyltransferase
VFALTSASYTIRRPEHSAEWEELKHLLVAYKSEFDDDTCFTSFEEELADIENLYNSEDRLKLIAVSNVDGTIAGCVAFRTYAPGVSEMKRLYVVPKYRGEKLGRILAEAIIEEAKTRGYQTMILDTMFEMKAAQELYKSLGFHVIPPYNHQNSNKVVCYEKELKTN